MCKDSVTETSTKFNVIVKLYNDGRREVFKMPYVCELGVEDFDDFKGFEEKEKQKKKEKSKKGQGRKDKKQENLERSVYRSKSKVKQYIYENDLKYHWVLTYAENMQNREKAVYDFKKFVQRLEYQLQEKFSYVAVLELQKRGAYHIHLATNNSIDVNNIKWYRNKDGNLEGWIDENSLMWKVWRNGIVKVVSYEEFGNKEKVAGYLTKYFEKEQFNKDGSILDLNGKRRYFNSRDLVLPATYKELKFDEKHEKALTLASDYFAKYDNGLKHWIFKV